MGVRGLRYFPEFFYIFFRKIIYDLWWRKFEKNLEEIFILEFLRRK